LFDLSTCRHTQGLTLEPTRGSCRLASRHKHNIKPPGQTHALLFFRALPKGGF
jgi:hypothetical protein